MTFDQYLLVGSYLFTFSVAVWAEHRFRQYTGNHLAHLKRRIKLLETMLGVTTLDD